jgi:hypothetical protein
MYRIELKPGEVNVFRTIEELATGIRNGLVTPKSRIFHNASQKWLPVEFHPHYKKALSMPATKSGETPAVHLTPPRAAEHVHAPIPTPVSHEPPTPPPPPAAPPPPRPQAKTRELTFIMPEPEPRPAPAPVAAKPKEPPAPPPMPSAAPVAVASPVAVLPPVEVLPSINYTGSTREHDEPTHPVAHAPLGRGPLGRHRPLHLAIAAVVLIAGTYAVVSAAMPSRKATDTKAGPTQDQPAPEPAVSTPTAAAPVDSTRASTLAATASGGGPTFGGAPAPRPPKRQVTASIGATPAPADTTTIEPPPATVDLSLPALPVGDSLAPVNTTDSTAMRKILRAVGGKGAPVPAR